MRAVIEYAYHQLGSTRHWERGKTDFRPALPEELSTPLGARGPRVAEPNQKTVWINVHIEIEPGNYQHEADAAFQMHYPEHTIIRRTLAGGA